MWDRMRAEGKGQGAKNFIKLKDGESVVGVFRGEPYVFYRVFQENTEYDSWAEGRNFRFRINFVVNDGTDYSSKIFEGGSRLRDELISCSDEYGLDSVYKITRKGTGKEGTSYKILFQSKLTGKALEKIKAVSLEVLRKGGKKVAQVLDDQEPPPFLDEDLPQEEDEDAPPF
jgi:hypothetical protein